MSDNDKRFAPFCNLSDACPWSLALTSRVHSWLRLKITTH